MLKAKFNVHPERRGVYYVVRVYDTVEAMNIAIQKAMFGDSPCIARCSSYDRISPDGKYSQEIGTVWFNNEHLGVGTVSHEFLHAALHWGEKIGLLKGLRREMNSGSVASGSNEERLCYALGWMVKDFVVKAQKKGLYA